MELIPSKDFNGCLVLVRTLNLELVVLAGADPKDCLGVLFEMVLLSVEESMEAVVKDDDEVEGLVLLIGCLCLTLNLDDALVDGITASVELSEVFLVVKEVSLIWSSPPPALVFKLTRPRCLILSLLLIKLLLVEAKDESVEVLGFMMDAGLGLNLCWPSRSVFEEGPRDLDLGLDLGLVEVEGLKGCLVCDVVSGGIVIVSTTAKFKKSFTLEAGLSCSLSNIISVLLGSLLIITSLLSLSNKFSRKLKLGLVGIGVFSEEDVAV